MKQGTIIIYFTFETNHDYFKSPTSFGPTRFRGPRLTKIIKIDFIRAGNIEAQEDAIIELETELSKFININYDSTIELKTTVAEKMAVIIATAIKRGLNIVISQYINYTSFDGFLTALSGKIVMKKNSDGKIKKKKSFFFESSFE